MSVRTNLSSGLDRYEEQMISARERFALSYGLQTLQSRRDPLFLEAFLLHFCSLGVLMTRPVEWWIGRAAERCAEIGLSKLARALARHAKAEAGHHLMMIADVESLTARWNALRQPAISADDLLRRAPSPGVTNYCRVHEDNINGETPYAQIAIEYEIEMLPLRFGDIMIDRCIEMFGTEIIPCLSFLTEHVKLDVAHTEMNMNLIKDLLHRDPKSISALVSAGAAALDAYATFVNDCVQLAEEESRKIHRPIGDSRSSTSLSWFVRSPEGDATREIDGMTDD